jgi:hypothetical protein
MAGVGQTRHRELEIEGMTPEQRAQADAVAAEPVPMTGPNKRERRQEYPLPQET